MTREWHDTVRVSYGAIDLEEEEETRPRRRRCVLCAGAEHCCLPTDTATVCKDVTFLFVQGVVAWCVGLLLLVTTAVSFVLLPLCGLGYLTFLLLFRCGVIDFFAKCDAAMINYVVPPADTIQIEPPANAGDDPTIEQSRDYGPPEQLITGLTEISVESCMVLVYLVTIRLLVAAVGLAVVAIVLGVPSLLLANSLFNTHLLIGSTTGEWEIVCIYTTLVLVFLVAIMSLDLVVALCSATTRFFCCERVYTLPLPRPGSSAPNARPNVVVVRFPPSSAGVYGFSGSTTSA